MFLPSRQGFRHWKRPPRVAMDVYFFSAVYLLVFWGTGVEAEPRNCTSAIRSCFEEEWKPDQPCLAIRQLLTCFGATRDVCQVEETRITFDQLVPPVVGACNDLSIPQPASTNCSLTLGMCVAELLNLTNPDDLDHEKRQQIIFRSISTTFWCRILEGDMGCYISSADSCSIPEDKVKVAQSYLDKVRTTCRTSGAETVTVRVLVYTAAVVLHWTRR